MLNLFRLSPRPKPKFLKVLCSIAKLRSSTRPQSGILSLNTTFQHFLLKQVFWRLKSPSEYQTKAMALKLKWPVLLTFNFSLQKSECSRNNPAERPTETLSSCTKAYSALCFIIDKLNLLSILVPTGKTESPI